MPSFFIDRPIFAWVVAIFIMVAGVIAIPLLPVSQYPNVAPPQISISTTYAGASSQDTYQSVTKLIENELNGVDGLLYFESSSSSSGSVSIDAPSRRAPIPARRPSTSRTACAASSRACPTASSGRACRSTRRAPASS